MVLWIIIAAIALFVGYICWGFYKVLVLDVQNYAVYWHEKATEKIQPNAIRLLALGDSTFQSIGATHPSLGTVGRVATYVERSTGRPVHVTNLSVSGATTEAVVGRQLVHADVASADIIIVAVGANDVRRTVDLQIYSQEIETLLRSLPQDITVVADVANVKNREPYQKILSKIRTKMGFHRANLRQAFAGARGWRLSGRDFFHPSDYGYQFWFKAFQPGIDTIVGQRFHEKTGR